MFQNACKALLQTIMPILVASRSRQGKVGCGIGAGMIVNDEGWFVTAGHILKNIAALDKQVSKYKSSSRHKGDQTTHYAAIFATTNVRLSRVLIQEELDLGVGKLEGYVTPAGHMFPRFRVHEVEQGELLCRLGYPFVDGIQPTWTKDKGFSFTNLFPVPMFVNEALVSRFAKLKTGVWIETSSPGLKGQSGGPLVDANGYICGIQVNTHHYPLGFEGQGRNQVLNVGRAVHVESVKSFLDTNNIKYLKEEE